MRNIAIRKNSTSTAKLALALIALSIGCSTKPSLTAAPVSTIKPAQASTPTELPPTANELSDLIGRDLEGEIRDLAFNYQGKHGILFISWNLQGFYTNELIARSAQRDTVEILRLIVESGLEFNQVLISGWYPMTVDINNTIEDTEVISLYFDRETLEERNWRTIRSQYIWLIADHGFVHQELLR
jgi:hypothetical protein